MINYLLIPHCKNGCTKAPQCYVTRTLPVLLFGKTRKHAQQSNCFDSRQQNAYSKGELPVGSDIKTLKKCKINRGHSLAYLLTSIAKKCRKKSTVCNQNNDVYACQWLSQKRPDETKNSTVCSKSVGS